MDEQRFSRLRSYAKELRYKRKEDKKEQIRKEQEFIRLFFPKIEAICKYFAKGVNWKYKKDGGGGCAIVKPAFLREPSIRVYLSESSEIHIIGRNDPEYSESERQEKRVSLDLVNSTFDKDALIEALEEEYKYIEECFLDDKTRGGW